MNITRRKFFKGIAAVSVVAILPISLVEPGTYYMYPGQRITDISHFYYKKIVMADNCKIYNCDLNNVEINIMGRHCWIYSCILPVTSKVL